jgi:phosphoribosylaminoimidazole-succinocarboxamide synthase
MQANFDTRNVSELIDTDVQFIRSGKVRDIYRTDDEAIVVIKTTDRISAFDRNIGIIPYKGAVLNKISQWWFKQKEIREIVPNHCMYSPCDNIMICHNCNIFPIEFVVRGYLTGSTATSIWTHYNECAKKNKDKKDKEIKYCGHVLPSGMKKHQKLPEPIVTPTTKSAFHDELITAEEIIDQGIMTAKQWEYCHDAALKLFQYGTEQMKERGLILVDTKYEFGIDASGRILLADELHTPDSSRYWIANTYELGKEPETIDKDILRKWYIENCSDPYTEETLPLPPHHLVKTVSQRYIELYERITGEKFITNELHKAIIIMGSKSDVKWVDKIIESLEKYGIEYETHQASAHRETEKVLNILNKHEEIYRKSSRTHRYVYITIAGMSNALSGVVASNTRFPTFACPPFKDAIDMQVNIQSTLQAPSGVPISTILHPENCALHIKKIFDMY